MPEPDNESLFRDALLDTCKWLEERDYPMSRLYNLIADSGAVAAAKQALASANWSDGLLELWGRGETSRSLEALVLRPEFCSLFTDKERAVAKTRLDDCSPAPRAEGEVILPALSIKRLIMGLVSAVPAQPPTSDPDPSRYNNLNPHERIAQQERDLNSGLPSKRHPGTGRIWRSARNAPRRILPWSRRTTTSTRMSRRSYGTC
jgi:hypothetical protein